MATAPTSNVAAELGRELNELLEAANDPLVEQQLVDARDRITDVDAPSLETALADAEELLADATDQTDSSDLTYELRELRQVLVGLLEGDH